MASRRREVVKLKRKMEADFIRKIRGTFSQLVQLPNNGRMGNRCFWRLSSFKAAKNN